jgi:hypothetical protein
MEYIKGTLAILFVPFFIGAMLLAAFWEKNAEEEQKHEKLREQGQQSRVPTKEVEKEPSPAPGVTSGQMTEKGGYSDGKQQTARTHGDDPRRIRKKRRR